MFIFEDIVSNLLTEADPTPAGKVPTWWNNIVTTYNNLNKENPLKMQLPDGDLATSLNTAIGSSSNISPSSYKEQYVPLMDLFRALYKTGRYTLSLIHI